MRTKEEILHETFDDFGIRKSWLMESKEAVLAAMERYAKQQTKLLEPIETPQRTDDGEIYVEVDDCQSNVPSIKRCFEYKTISAHNNDLYDYGKWAYKHLIELGKQGYEIVKVQEQHECASWVLLKRERNTKL